MRKKKWIMICIILIIFAVLGATVYLYNPPHGNEIMFIGYQFVPPVAENEKGTDIFILVNRKGQYFTLNLEEMQEKGKSIMEVKDYYSHNKYVTDGRILNPLDMFLCCKWLEKVDTSAECENEFFSSANYSAYRSVDLFSIKMCVSVDQENINSIQKNGGISIYNVTNLHSLQVDYLDDTYAKKIVNKLLKNWPIKNGEEYIERKTWLE